MMEKEALEHGTKLIIEVALYCNADCHAVYS